MCPKGSQLYLAWTRLVPQIPSNRYDLLPLMKQVTPQSEAARLAYEKHYAACPICHQADETRLRQLGASNA